MSKTVIYTFATMETRNSKFIQSDEIMDTIRSTPHCRELTIADQEYMKIISKLTEELYKYKTNNPSKLFFPEEFIIKTLPENYIVVGEYKTCALKYIKGHPSGKNYETSDDFAPHLFWIITRNFTDERCTCCLCNVSTTETIPQKPIKNEPTSVENKVFDFGNDYSKPSIIPKQDCLEDNKISLQNWIAENQLNTSTACLNESVLTCSQVGLEKGQLELSQENIQENIVESSEKVLSLPENSRGGSQDIDKFTAPDYSDNQCVYSATETIVESRVQKRVSSNDGLDSSEDSIKTIINFVPVRRVVGIKYHLRKMPRIEPIPIIPIPSVVSIGDPIGILPAYEPYAHAVNTRNK
ncbi:hypothetical protein CLU79DRAFT_756080 [Phycomyces nitens]|nr:hypothetical protein CLU79DRAFT_756080 [Phycomyces nitens]